MSHFDLVRRWFDAFNHASRQYPSTPIVGVGAVIVQYRPDEAQAGTEAQRVVLVRRRYEPLAGQWSLPGGRLELGETLEAGLGREMVEETGLEIAVGPVVEVFDRILLDQEQQVRFHYVLIDYLCWPVGGTLSAGSDVDDAVWAAEEDLPAYQLTEKATEVVGRGFEMVRRGTGPGGS